MSQQITLLYDTVQEIGREDFLTALERAAEQQMYGAEYVQAILGRPRAAARWVSTSPNAHPPWPGQNGPGTLERDLALYEHYVANRDSLLEEERARR
jgi:hypothetical protein